MSLAVQQHESEVQRSEELKESMGAVLVEFNMTREAHQMELASWEQEKAQLEASWVQEKGQLEEAIALNEQEKGDQKSEELKESMGAVIAEFNKQKEAHEAELASWEQEKAQFEQEKSNLEETIALNEQEKGDQTTEELQE